MTRYLIIASRILSVFLCFAMVLFWVRSFYRIDVIKFETTKSSTAFIMSNRGMISIATADISRFEPSWPFLYSEKVRGRPSFIGVVPHSTFRFGAFAISNGTRFGPIDSLRGFAAEFPHWFLALLIVIWILFLTGIPAMHRWKRRRMSLCVNCRYDLRDSRDECPECGTRRLDQAPLCPTCGWVFEVPGEEEEA